MLLLLASLALAAPDVVLDDALDVVPDEPVWFVPFEVPEGTVEIRVSKDDLSDANILDWGLMGPDGFRGWSGSNGGDDVIGTLASTPGYVPGPMPGGWELMIGFAQTPELPIRWHVEVTFATTASMPPDPDRQAWEAPAPIRTTPGWYGGDFHVHSIQSGDARPTLDEVADEAIRRGLDFVELSEHNTIAHLGLLPAVQRRHPSLLLVPGIEWTTYRGHANAIGVTDVVPFWVGTDGLTANDAAAAVQAQGGLFSPNHPQLDLPGLCTGCGWKQPVDVVRLSGLEVQSGSVDVVGTIMLDGAIALWESWLDQGVHVAAIGGSDDHQGGQGGGAFYSPLGEPRTYVQAEALSVDGILDGIRAGRTVIQLGGPDDPWVEIDSVLRDGDTIEAAAADVDVRVERGEGGQLVLVQDGEVATIVDVDADPWTHTFPITAPDQGETRVRAQVLVGGVPRTITSHLWVRRPTDTGAPSTDEPAACGCATTSPPSAFPLLLLAVAGRRRVERDRSSRR